MFINKHTSTLLLVARQVFSAPHYLQVFRQSKSLYYQVVYKTPFCHLYWLKWHFVILETWLSLFFREQQQLFLFVILQFNSQIQVIRYQFSLFSLIGNLHQYIARCVFSLGAKSCLITSGWVLSIPPPLFQQLHYIVASQLLHCKVAV